MPIPGTRAADHLEECAAAGEDRSDRRADSQRSSALCRSASPLASAIPSNNGSESRSTEIGRRPRSVIAAGPRSPRAAPYSLLHLGRIDGVSAPAPSCGGGQGWGVARTEEIIECAIARSSRRTARPPSSVLPHKGLRRSHKRVVFDWRMIAASDSTPVRFSGGVDGRWFLWRYSSFSSI